MDIIWTLIVGLIVGWLAGVIVRGYGFGIVGNISVGIVGALIGDWVFGALGWGSSLGIHFVSALIGAVILLLIIGLFRSNKM